MSTSSKKIKNKGTRFSKSDAKDYAKTHSVGYSLKWNQIRDKMKDLGFAPPDTANDERSFFFKRWSNGKLIDGDEKSNIHVTFFRNAWNDKKKIHIFHITDGRKKPSTHWYFDVDYQTFCAFEGGDLGQHSNYKSYSQPPYQTDEGNPAADGVPMQVWNKIRGFFQWDPVLFQVQEFHFKLSKMKNRGKIEKKYFDRYKKTIPEIIFKLYVEDLKFNRKKDKKLKGYGAHELPYNDVIDQAVFLDYNSYDDVSHGIDYDDGYIDYMGHEYSKGQSLASNYLAGPSYEPLSVLTIFLVIFGFVFCWFITCISSSACGYIGGYIAGRGVTKKTTELDDIESNDSQFRI